MMVGVGMYKQPGLMAHWWREEGGEGGRREEKKAIIFLMETLVTT